jgi:hypothetical protein
MDNSELQKRYFSELRTKYQVGTYKNTTSDSFLYLILRKAQLGIQVTAPETQWLGVNGLFRTIEIISLQQYQAEDSKRLEVECLNLRSKYRIPEELELPISSPVYSLLWKSEAGDFPTNSEFELLSSYALTETIHLIRENQNFSKLKIRCKATKYVENFPVEPLYAILKKLDVADPLSDCEADWLLEHDFEETLEIHWQQENTRKAIVEFSDLKAKYRIDSLPDASLSSPLYSILKKLQDKQDLEEIECDWLKQQKLTQLITIDQKRKDVKLFKKLKAKYLATQYRSSEPSSKLFQILKNMDSSLTEDDIQWLTNEELLETATIAKINHFRILKVKYQILDKLAVDPFYEIFLKLERQERLDSKQLIQLMEDKSIPRHGKISIAHYSLEAIFYEKEYQRTNNQWNLASASSNWRKADKPQNALEVTKNINWKKVQGLGLKSALWVTRGGALRDLAHLDNPVNHIHLKEAEECAAEAMECQPKSHQPYTLMGAICYNRGEYLEGDKWFKMAIERGAVDTDNEVKKIVRTTKDKDKLREVVEYLLKKDPIYYSWARQYLK